MDISLTASHLLLPLILRLVRGTFLHSSKQSAGCYFCEKTKMIKKCFIYYLTTSAGHYRHFYFISSSLYHFISLSLRSIAARQHVELALSRALVAADYGVQI